MDEIKAIEEKILQKRAEKKAVLAQTTEYDARLWKLTAEQMELQKQYDQTYRRRSYEVERQQREKHADRLEAELKEIKGKLEALTAENIKLRESDERKTKQLNDMEGLEADTGNKRLLIKLRSLQERLFNEACEREHAQAGGMSNAVKKELEGMRRHIDALTSKVNDLQQENSKLRTQVASLKDENEAQRQTSAETRQRQLKELQSTSTLTTESQQRTGTA